MKENEEITDSVVVPKERIAVIVGKKGATKKDIEKKCKVKISIDSKTGEVSITRKTFGDVLEAIRAVDIIKAIGIGFTPQKAFKLLRSNIYIDQIDLSDCVDNSAMTRVKSRIIGREGRARSKIEKLTSTKIIIGRKMVSIVGEPENVNLAKRAVYKLIKGSSHSAVFKFLDRVKRKKVD